MDVAKHWHAYHWVGHERPADAVRMQHSENYPAIETAHYLLKPVRHVVQTFQNDEVGQHGALAWMREGGTEHVHVDAASFSLDSRLEWVWDNVKRGADVVWGYYTVKSRYVSRALVACPRGGQACPYGT
ncbi:hypothetical protein [Streptomyces sp. NPDC086782]|uniref:hypothetical protein n=1 Tax=Streptomyces sp. NPDC086782 TaxID=3365757 RepID=UPI0037F7D07A